MLKKLFLFFTFIFYFAEANASFWDELVNCFSNPCNCGFGKRYERWNGQVLDKGDQNPICPPWNKEAGRNDNICLVQFQYPPIFTQYFQLLCAESTNESTYFEPKIKVRSQNCNGLACWTTANSLGWDGQCVTLAGPYGLPLTRMCSRIALPADPIRNMPADPGYTIKKHLNFEGVTLNDDPIVDSNNNVIDVNPPKLCAYLDPAFIGTGDQGFDIDFLDLDPNKQPFHKTTKTHPVIKVVIFLIETAAEVKKAPGELISALFGMMDNGEEGETTFAKVIGSLFEGISWLIDFFVDILVSMLKDIGQINRVVSGNNYGCVNLPMGPYPPPCCTAVNALAQEAIVQRICETGSDGLPIKSIESKECVVSKQRNNFIHNSMRVSFDNLVPLCRNGEEPLDTDKCVSIDNFSSFALSSIMHTVTSRRDVIKPCTIAASGQPCVRSKIPYSCSITQNGCEDGFRVVYGVRINNQISPRSYFRDDLKDCSSSSELACQDIWGINTGEFIDIALQFPANQNLLDLLPLANSFALKDKNGTSVAFTSSIVRNPVFNIAFNFQQQPEFMCVFQPDLIVGCVDRAKFAKPSVYNCTSSHAGLTCSSDYFQPRLIVSAESGGDSTSAVVTPLSVYDSGSVVNYSSVNLAGFDFDSFVTDENEAKKPFSGANAPNPSSIFGTYKGGASPLNANNSENTSAVYLKGIEYVNGRYFRGGKQVCLEQLETQKCPTDTTKCVLTYLKNRDVVNCITFVQKTSQYQGLRLCDASFTGCTNTDSIAGKSGGAGITIKSCANSKYCYTTALNQELCVITTLLSDRHTPASSFGKVIPDSQFFDINGSPGLSYDQSTFALRDKTSYEMNLCTNIPTVSCAGVTASNATWPAALVGDISTGTCQSGFIVSGTLQRYCLVNSTTKTFAFETIAGMGCVAPPPPPPPPPPAPTPTPTPTPPAPTPTPTPTPPAPTPTPTPKPKSPWG